MRDCVTVMTCKSMEGKWRNYWEENNLEENKMLKNDRCLSLFKGSLIKTTQEVVGCKVWGKGKPNACWTNEIKEAVEEMRRI